MEIARHGRVIQAQFGTHVGEAFGGRRLAKDLLGHVAGQQHCAAENKDGCCEEEHQAQRNALGYQFYNGVHDPAALKRPSTSI
ncbi:hypothetical protein GCM10007927_21230 [Sulfitobacter pacificus]|uniref:Uncharacterized protein n=1 Tax=Sulfitobacter pacificus TaxID=1499314 RepID=A0ABQ5VJQ4_9RHOB|nr:hypothetical protein GCM10007927_21230 [Sulfitobacter pacificus]